MYKNKSVKHKMFAFNFCIEYQNVLRSGNGVEYFHLLDFVKRLKVLHI